ncbi:putative quinol monooxygenase [Chitinophaga sp. NPDC101104]|uniref:putative quinol monooxygenase n=1 Tax=Chitinophaga sp. NPDC101104 TaxID=3390561 RepID=UPI003D02034F
MKIYLTAVIKVKPEYLPEVEKAVRNMVTETRKEAACIQYDLHQGLDDKHVFVFYEIWKDQQGLDAHNQQPYILEFGNIAQAKLLEPPQIYVTHIIDP